MSRARIRAASPRERAEMLSDVAERVALWNEFRTDDFQDQVVHEVNAVRESWRHDGDLPHPGEDPVYDALALLADVADSSPIAVRDACADAFRVSEDARAVR